ncbi:Bacteriophage CI repressor helix-turn-helix domain protein [compost metagenome]
MGRVNGEFPILGNKSAAAVLDRLQKVLGVKNDTQLGEALQVNRSTVGNWRNRDSVPYTICVDAAIEHGVSLDWLLTGEGEMPRHATDRLSSSGAEYSAFEMSPREMAILELFRELDEADQREIQRVAEEKKRLTSLEQRLAELEAVVADVKRLA